MNDIENEHNSKNTAGSSIENKNDNNKSTNFVKNKYIEDESLKISNNRIYQLCQILQIFLKKEWIFI